MEIWITARADNFLPCVHQHVIGAILANNKIGVRVVASIFIEVVNLGPFRKNTPNRLLDDQDVLSDISIAIRSRMFR